MSDKNPSLSQIAANLANAIESLIKDVTEDLPLAQVSNCCERLRRNLAVVEDTVPSVAGWLEQRRSEEIGQFHDRVKFILEAVERRNHDLTEQLSRLSDRPAFLSGYSPRIGEFRRHSWIWVSHSIPLEVMGKKLTEALRCWSRDIHAEERIEMPQPHNSARESFAENIFKKESTTWTARFNGGPIQGGITAWKGLDDVCYLLQYSGKQIDVFDLPGNRGAQPRTADAHVATREDGIALLQQITRKQAELVSEDDSLVGHDLEVEIAALRSQFNANFDKHGNPRKLAGDATRVVATTQKRINERLYDKLREISPELVRHLENHLTISRECRYIPEGEMHWDLGEGQK